MSVYAERGEPLNQGDIFHAVEFSIARGGDRTIETFDGMVISHHCDCDKFHVEKGKGDAHDIERFPIALAPVYKLEDLKGGQGGDAKACRIRRFFFIEAEGDREELVVDLWWEQPIPAVVLLEKERIASVSDDYLRRMHIQLWELRTRVPFHEINREKGTGK